MRGRGVPVQDILEKYQKHMKHFDSLHGSLGTHVIQLEMNNNTMNTITSVKCTCVSNDIGVTNNLDHLPSEHNVKAVDDILYDVVVRKRCLLSRLATLTPLLGETS